MGRAATLINRSLPYLFFVTLVRSIEEAIADSLITAKQKGATGVTLVEGDGGVVAVPADPAEAEVPAS